MILVIGLTVLIVAIIAVGIISSKKKKPTKKGRRSKSGGTLPSTDSMEETLNDE